MRASRTAGGLLLALLAVVATGGALAASTTDELDAAAARKDVSAALAFARSLAARATAPGRDGCTVAHDLAELAGRLVPLAAPDASALAQQLLEAAIARHEPGGSGPPCVDALALAVTLGQLSTLHFDAGRWERCEPLDRRVVALRGAAQGEGHPEVAQARQDLALDLYRLGRFAEAEAQLRLAVAALEGADPPRPEALADALGYLGENVRAQGRLREAEPLLLRSLALGPSARSTLLNNLSGFYRDQNRYAEALWRLGQALALEESREAPDRRELVVLWNNMAELYRFQGDRREAERYYRKAVESAREVLGPDHSRLGTLLNQLAELCRETGRAAEAEALYREALAVKTRGLGPEHPDLAHTYEGLGRLLGAGGRRAEALAALRTALRLREARLGASHPDSAEARLVLAELLDAAEADRPEARRLLDRAIADLEAAQAEGRTLALALERRAAGRRSAGEPAAAREDLARALAIVERLRPEAGGGEHTRAEFGALHAAQFARLARWLVEDGDLDGAWRVSERGRSRALLDRLEAGHVDLKDGIEEAERRPFELREAALLERLARDRERLQQTDAVPETGAEQARLARAVDETEADFARLREDVQNASRYWRGFAAAGAVGGLAEAQRRVVARDGLLLCYVIDEARSFVFVVPPPGEPPRALSLEIPPDAAGPLSVAPGALTSSALRAILAPESADPSAPEGLLARLGRPPGPSGSRPALDRALHALWRVLLPGQLWPRLRAAREVVVVPDGLLHQVAFEALVVGRDAGGPRFWLDEGPPLRYAHSAATSIALAARPAVRAARGLVSVADPVYDPRASDPAGRAARGLDRLPGTAREAAAVLAAFAASRAPGEVVSLQRLEAREPRVRAALPGARYLHLATHGLVDAGRGELFASLALTPPPSRGTPQDDGLLELHEILGLRLDAELAVLSSCESRAGELVPGEGAFTLARGFLAAGARRVVASLWPAEDESAADLFGALFLSVARGDVAGKPVDYTRALADAKRRVRARPGRGDPFFWAGFVLEGAP